MKKNVYFGSENKDISPIKPIQYVKEKNASSSRSFSRSYSIKHKQSKCKGRECSEKIFHHLCSCDRSFSNTLIFCVCKLILPTFYIAQTLGTLKKSLMFETITVIVNLKILHFYFTFLFGVHPPFIIIPKIIPAQVAVFFTDFNFPFADGKIF